MLQVVGKSLSFLLDMAHAVLPLYSAPTHPSSVAVMGIDGTSSTPKASQPLTCSLYGFPFSHFFLIIPYCPVPLLGRDILHKLQATICLSPSPLTSVHLILPLLPYDSSSIPDCLPSVDPQIWDISRPQVATHQ